MNEGGVAVAASSGDGAVMLQTLSRRLKTKIAALAPASKVRESITEAMGDLRQVGTLPLSFREDWSFRKDRRWIWCNLAPLWSIHVVPSMLRIKSGATVMIPPSEARAERIRVILIHNLSKRFSR